jgi:predicted secreted protein
MTKKSKTYLPLILFLLLAFAPAAVFAGDYATLNFVGFSKDGNYLAFEEYGSQDGTGYPYANVYFIDVAKNAFVGAPFRVKIEKETATEAAARKQAKLAAAKKMLELKIVQGNTGTHTVSRLITELPLGTGKEFQTEKLRFAEEIGSMYQRGDYTLTLNPIETTTKECEPYELPVYKIELTLLDNEVNKTKFLQKDATLPTSRGCAIDYHIQEVYTYEGKIAVFLNVFEPGFEGADMRYMVVTGILE